MRPASSPRPPLLAAAALILALSGLATPTPAQPTWTQVSLTGRQPGGPTNGDQFGRQMAYDEQRGKIVLATSGWDNGNLASPATWEWDGLAWSQRAPYLAPGQLQQGAGMVYDAARGVTVVFAVSETWEWDGSTWTQRFPANSPSRREHFGMAYYTGGKVVLFGGKDTHSNTFYNDTWQWDGSNWTQLMPATSPGRRQGCTMVWSEVQRGIVLFGGHRVPPHLNFDDTWVLTCGVGGVWHWTEMIPNTRPPSRASLAAFQPGRKAAHVSYLAVSSGSRSMIVSSKATTPREARIASCCCEWRGHAE